MFTYVCLQFITWLRFQHMTTAHFVLRNVFRRVVRETHVTKVFYNEAFETNNTVERCKLSDKAQSKTNRIREFCVIEMIAADRVELQLCL